MEQNKTIMSSKRAKGEVNSRISKNKIANNKIEVVGENTGRLVLVDYEKAKSQILTELYYSSDFKTKAKSYIFKNYKAHLSNIDDILQEVYVEMLKKDAEYLFNQYVKNPNSILAISLTILKTFFLRNRKYPDYPNKSIVHKLRYHTAGSWNTKEVLPTDYLEYGENGDVDPSVTILEDFSSQDLVEENLSDKDKYISAVDRILDKLDNEGDKRKLLSILKSFDKNGANTKALQTTLTKNAEFLVSLRTIFEEEGITSIEDLLA